LLGQRINNCDIRSVLGEGGMGKGHLADHPFSGRQVAVKILRRSLAESAAPVEARELLEPESLADRLARGPAARAGF
jgi:serine/threonine protein kinase